MRRTLAMVVALALVAFGAGISVAGEYHSGATLLCSDCHTMHFSQQHGWAGGAVSTTFAMNGDWLSATGPNAFLLKAPANELCQACHSGQSLAPDVVGANVNTSPVQGREAGALNVLGGSGDYAEFKGHTLGSTAVPPGYDPTLVGGTPWYDASGGLECISCHAQHGPATAYRNLGPYSMTGITGVVRPTYAISTTNDTTKDVWIALASYSSGSADAATFNPYYDFASISFNRNDATVGSTKTSNKMDTFCAACHANFHGGAEDANIGATVAALDGFLRHPTSQVTIGAAGAQGHGGHSSLSRFVANTTKVKVYATDHTGYTDASPGCVTCHKSHGNKNPFGLVFLNRAATSVDEEGGLATGQVASNNLGARNLCGQCHSQGN